MKRQRFVRTAGSHRGTIASVGRGDGVVRRLGWPLIAIVSAIVLSCAAPANAQTFYTWNTATTGTNWGDSNRWSGSGTTLTSGSNWGNLDFTTYAGQAFNNLTTGTVTSISGTTRGLALSGNGIALQGNIARGQNEATWTIPISVASGVSSTWSQGNPGFRTNVYSGTLTGSGTLVFNASFSSQHNTPEFSVLGGAFAGTFIQDSSILLRLNTDVGPSATVINKAGGILLSENVTYQSKFILRGGADDYGDTALVSQAGNFAPTTTTVTGSITIDAVYSTGANTFGLTGGQIVAGHRMLLTGNVGEANGSRNVFVSGPVTTAVVFSGTNSWTGTTGVNSGAAIFTRAAAVYQGNTANWTADKFRNAGAIGIDPGGFTAAEQAAFISAVTGSYSGIGSNGWQNGASFGLYSTTSGTFSEVLSNAVSNTRTVGLIKYGAGEVVITGTANTFTGVTRVVDGTLTVTRFGNGGQAGSIGQASSAAANILLGRGQAYNQSDPTYSVLRYVGSGETTDRSFTFADQSIRGFYPGATIDASGSGELIMTGTGMAWSTDDGTVGRLFLGGANTGTNVMGLRLANGTRTWGGAVDLSLLKIGLGTWKLTGSNQIGVGATGGITVSSGKLILGSTAASAGAASITIGLIAGESVGGTTTPILGLDFTDTLAQNIVLTSTDTAIEALAGRVATVSGVISGGASTPLKKLGTGVLVLSASNTYTGATTVAEGQLRLSGSFGLTGGIGASGGLTALIIGTGSSSGVVGLAANDFSRGLGTSASQVKLHNGGFAAYGANREVNFGGSGAAVTWNGANADFMGASGTFVLGASDSGVNTVIFRNALNVGGSGTRTLDVVLGAATGTAAEFRGALDLASGATLRKIGSGLLLLSGTTSSTGTFEVAAGTVKFNSSGVGNSGRFVISTTTSTIDLGGQTVSGATIDVRAGLLTGGAINSSRLAIDNVTDFGTISGEVTGNTALTKAGSGRLTLSSSNSYAGTMTVNGGGLRLDNGDGLRNATLAGSSSGSVSFGSGVTAARFGVLGGTAGISLTNAGNGAVTLTVGSSGTYAGVMSGTGGVTVAQNVLLRLTGANTFTGETLISSGGTVALGSGGSIASRIVTVGGTGATGSVLDLQAKTSYAFAANQTLRGNGKILGGAGLTTVTISGSLLPGNSPGTLTFENTNVVLESTARTVMEITGTTAGTQYDVISLIGSGTLTYGGTLALYFTQTFESGTFNLFSFGASTGTFSSIVFEPGSVYGGNTWNYVSNGLWTVTSGSMSMEFRQSVSGPGIYYGQLSVTAVPEPLTLGLFGVGGGVAVLTYRRARRRRRAA